METHVEIACNNNNMRNPSLHFISWGYACCYLSVYYSLVSLFFDTTIPTSFNILMKCFCIGMASTRSMKMLRTLDVSYKPF